MNVEVLRLLDISDGDFWNDLYVGRFIAFNCRNMREASTTSLADFLGSQWDSPRNRHVHRHRFSPS